MGAFDLPKLMVYVWFENGTSENVAFMDTLSADRAKKFKETLERVRWMKVVKVTLEDRHKRVYRTYEFV